MPPPPEKKKKNQAAREHSWSRNTRSVRETSESDDDDDAVGRRRARVRDRCVASASRTPRWRASSSAARSARASRRSRDALDSDSSEGVRLAARRRCLSKRDASKPSGRRRSPPRRRRGQRRHRGSPLEAPEALRRVSGGDLVPQLPAVRSSFPRARTCQRGPRRRLWPPQVGSSEAPGRPAPPSSARARPSRNSAPGARLLSQPRARGGAGRHRGRGGAAPRAVLDGSERVGKAPLVAGPLERATRAVRGSGRQTQFHAARLARDEPPRVDRSTWDRHRAHARRCATAAARSPHGRRRRGALASTESWTRWPRIWRRGPRSAPAAGAPRGRPNSRSARGAPGAPCALHLTDGRSIADGRLPGPRRRDDDAPGSRRRRRRRAPPPPAPRRRRPRRRPSTPPRAARRPQLPGPWRPPPARPGPRSPRPLSKILRRPAARAPARGRAQRKPGLELGPARRIQRTRRHEAERPMIRGDLERRLPPSTVPHWAPPNNVTSAPPPRWPRRRRGPRAPASPRRPSPRPRRVVMRARRPSARRGRRRRRSAAPGASPPRRARPRPATRPPPPRRRRRAGRAGAQHSQRRASTRSAARRGRGARRRRAIAATRAVMVMSSIQTASASCSRSRRHRPWIYGAWPSPPRRGAAAANRSSPAARHAASSRL